ncbi:MAG TPA: c-type cytochrome [Thermoanaerobaculia bacterium]|nr:c-type cytochrome [Thermoanaerobaculia bacterium]
MKKLVLIILALSIGACAPRPMTLQPQTAEIAAGHKLFDQHCAACHGEAATGTKYAPDLRRASARDAEVLFRFVTNGDLRHGMPSWSRLPDQRRWQIVSYLKSLNARRGSPS